MDFVKGLCEAPAESSKTMAIVATTVVATISALSLARYALYPTRKPVIPGPLTTSLPKLPKAELEKVPYQPDHFPGARDVVTPVSA